ncbi:MAG: hypothetical protein ACLFV2_09265 [Desulfurivibrionaceae bacterium]
MLKKFLCGLAVFMMMGFSMGCESPEQPGDVGQQQEGQQQGQQQPDTPSQEQPGE